MPKTNNVDIHNEAIVIWSNRLPDTLHAQLTWEARMLGYSSLNQYVNILLKNRFHPRKNLRLKQNLDDK